MERCRAAVRLAVLLGGLWPASAQATPDATEVAVVRNLWERAREAEAASRWKDCEHELRGALRIMETPGLLYHLAYCEEQQRLWIEALSDYKRADTLIRSGIEAPDVEELLQATLARLELQIPTLTLRVDKLPPGVSLYIDGKEYSTGLLARPIALNPGSRTVNLAAPGYRPLSQELNLLPSEARTLQVVLVAERASHAAPPVITSEPPSMKPYWMIAEGALLLGGVTTGVVFSLEQSHAEREQRTWLGPSDDDESVCLNNDAIECQRAERAQQDAKDAERNMWIGFSVASAGALAVIGTWLLWPSAEKEPVRVAVAPQPHGAGVSLAGAF